MSFAEAWAHRVQGLYGKTPVFYLGKAELIRNKEAVGRPEDQADLQSLRSSEP